MDQLNQDFFSGYGDGGKNWLLLLVLFYRLMFFLSLFFQCIYGCYVHSAILPTFHRRCYWLLQVLLLKRSLLGFWQNILQKGRIMYYVHVLLQLKVNCKLHVNWNFILYFTFSCNSLKYSMSWSGPLRVCVEKNMHIIFI